jgi:hypothetical protein
MIASTARIRMPNNLRSPVGAPMAQLRSEALVY